MILLLGAGDIAQRIGQRYAQQGHAVTAVARSAETLAACQALGFTCLALDLAQAPPLPAASHIFYCAAPPAPLANGQGDPTLAAVLATLPPPAQGLLYLSTTGVYGDCQGRWITEAEPLKPQSARGQRRLAAERSLRAWAAHTGGRALTLRVPGIYGPGRLPRARILNGQPVLCAADSPYSNRIHADDLAAAAQLLMDGQAQGAYHLSDGSPSSITEYFHRTADFYGLPRLPEVGMAQAKQAISPALMSFLEENKRLDISAIQALGFVPRYKNLAAGIASCR